MVASFLTQRQLSINAGWQHMGRVPHPNYIDPKCCVATVCHQVRCMFWGHLSHFHRAISHLEGHKIVCMRYVACTFSQMKSIDKFSMYLQSGIPRHVIWWFIAGWTSYNHLISTMEFPMPARGHLYPESGPRILIKSIENSYAWNRLHRLSGSKTVLHLDSEKNTCEKSTTLHIPESCHVRL